jgi:hypothetical protein
MKHHLVPPIATAATNESMRPQHPEKLKTIVEDPVTESRDMRCEQQAAFISPAEKDDRVRKSQGDQGRT